MTFASIVYQIIGLVNTTIPVLSSIAVLLFMYGVMRYVWSTVEGQKGRSKEIMYWGIIAMFVLFMLWGILRFISQAFTGGSSTNTTQVGQYQPGVKYQPNSNYQTNPFNHTPSY